MKTSHKCFCGSNLAFQQCCLPFINMSKSPQSAEKLMRSRFSAYQSQQYQYIFDTYAKESQHSLTVENIKESGENSLWIALVIHDNAQSINNSEIAQHYQYVEFSAFYINEGALFEMRERSRFALEVCQSSNLTKEQWRYIDGDIIKHEQLEKLSRNQPCPCNNYSTSWVTKKGKKYKQCCGK